MKLKVCGLREPHNIEQISRLAIDYIGFIFYKNSPRYIGDRISFDFVRSIPKHIQKTGVFVDEDSYSIFSAIARYDLDAVQLHGNESKALCQELKPYVKVIKAVGIKEDFDFKTLESYVPHVDYFLFDTYSPQHGGSGTSFDYTILQNYHYEIPFFLSGGIDGEALQQIRKLPSGQLAALDLNSKFETEPGVKDPAKLATFIKQLNPDDHANLFC